MAVTLYAYVAGPGTAVASWFTGALTTIGPTLLVVDVLICGNGGAAPPAVSSLAVESLALTFTLRSSKVGLVTASGNFNRMERWYAYAPSAIAAKRCAVTLASALYDDAMAVMYAFNGCAAGSPWAAHASMPAQSAAQPPSFTGIGVDEADSMYLMAAGTEVTGSDPTPATGFTRIVTELNGGGVRYAKFNAFHMALIAPESGKTYTMGAMTISLSPVSLLDSLLGVPITEPTIAKAEGYAVIAPLVNQQSAGKLGALVAVHDTVNMKSPKMSAYAVVNSSAQLLSKANAYAVVEGSDPPITTRPIIFVCT